MTALRLPRPRPFRPLAILGASIVLVVASQAASVLRTTSPARVAPVAHPPVEVSGSVAAPDAPAPGAPASVATIDHSIAAWSKNVAANDRDYISAMNLAVLYEVRARLSGNIGDYARATEAAERSLAIEPRQLDVQALHARLLLSTHEFAAALLEAQAIDRQVPDQPAILSIMADAQLELGATDDAAALFARIEIAQPGPAIMARLAHLTFLRGDPVGAVAGAEAAFDAAVAAGQEGPSLGWYAYLAGMLHLSAGSPADAATWFDRAADAWPGSPLALDGRARAAAAVGSVDAAIDGYRAAIAAAPEPDALIALGDLLAMTGHAVQAEDQYEAALALLNVRTARGTLIYSRQLTLFDVNHERDLAAALALAEQDVAVRKDPYGFDAYAWALLANGRAEDADAAMAVALAGGLRDASVLYHAGAIKLAIGDGAAARSLLTQALAITGALDPLSASRAQAALASLETR